MAIIGQHDGLLLGNPGYQCTIYIAQQMLLKRNETGNEAKGSKGKKMRFVDTTAYMYKEIRFETKQNFNLKEDYKPTIHFNI